VRRRHLAFCQLYSPSGPEGNRSKPVDQTPMSAAKGLGAAAAAAPLLARKRKSTEAG
jgi:hypothetical protein